MWKCGDCRCDVVFDSVEPEVDNDGCYFICPECGARNPLINVGPSMYGEPDSLILAQPSILGQGWKPGRK